MVKFLINFLDVLDHYKHFKNPLKKSNRVRHYPPPPRKYSDYFFNEPFPSDHSDFIIFGQKKVAHFY